MPLADLGYTIWRQGKSGPGPRVIYPATWIASHLARRATRSTSTSDVLLVCGRAGTSCARLRGGSPLLRSSCTWAPSRRARPAAFAYSAARLPECMPRSGASCSPVAAPVRPRRLCGRPRGSRADPRAATAAALGRRRDPRGVHRIGVRHRRPGPESSPRTQIEFNKLRERLLAARIADPSDDSALAAASATTPRSPGCAAPSGRARRHPARHARRRVRTPGPPARRLVPRVPALRAALYQARSPRSCRPAGPSTRIVEQPFAGQPARRYRADSLRRDLAFLRVRDVEDLAPRYDEGSRTATRAWRPTSSTTRSGVSSTATRAARPYDTRQGADAAAGIRPVLRAGRIDADAQVNRGSRRLVPDRLEPAPAPARNRAQCARAPP